MDYYRGDRLVLINKGEAGRNLRANLVIKDAIGKVLEAVTEG